MTAGQIRKAIAAVVGFALSLGSAGLLPDDVAKWVSSAIAFLTALGVYAVKNDPVA